MQQRVFLNRIDLPKFNLDDGIGEKTTICQDYNYSMKIEKLEKLITNHCLNHINANKKNNKIYDKLDCLIKDINTELYNKLKFIYNSIINSNDIYFVIQIIELLKTFTFNSIEEIILQLNNLIEKSGIYQEERNDV